MTDANRRGDAVQDFLARYFRDEDADAVRELADYQADYPGHETQIAAAWRRLREIDAESSEPAENLRSLGPLRLVREIARGGQGVVFVAEDTRFRRIVAVKALMHGPAGAWSEVAVQRLRREAEVASRLHHPGICPVHELGVDNGIPYLVMPFLPGRSLSRICKDGPLPADRAHELVEQVARAVHAAHEVGIVHRDLKPSNIMVMDDGRAVVMDFGIAQDADQGGATLTATGDLLGTLPYMAPEQVQDGAVDRRTDVYALGITLFECLTGSLPFAGGTQRALMNSIVHDTPPIARRHHPAIRPDTSVVLATALAKEPQRRFATAEEFADELQRIREHRPIHSRPVGPVVRLRQWVRRNPRLAGSLAATFAILLAGLIVSLLLLRDVANERQRAQTALDEIDMLTDLTRLDELTTELRAFEPPQPDHLPALAQWIERATALADRLPAQEQLLTKLRADATPYDEQQRQIDFDAHPMAIDWYRMRESREFIADQLERHAAKPEAEQNDAFRKQRQLELDVLDKTIPQYETAIAKTRSWLFESARARWRHDRQAKLVRALKDFVADDRFGRTIARGRHLEDQAKQLAERARSDAEAWATCRQQVLASERYDGLDLKPQRALFPLGADPKSGLFEFVDVTTGAIPKRGDDGQLAIDGTTGVVFVLIPAGTARVGATRPRKKGSLGPHEDPGARPTEAPVHDVRLDAFFLSKYELTQAQWLRQSATNTSQTRIGNTFPGQPKVTGLHPVEGVSWDGARRVLTRCGFELPTSAQWEYAARGGTTTPFHTGASPRSLHGHANIADLTFARSVGQQHQAILRVFDDGWATHAPVGSFAPNAFGLHDTLGNVQEWCLDRNPRYRFHVLPGDGARTVGGSVGRVIRGASFAMAVTDARCAAFRTMRKTLKGNDIGIRPMRPVD